MHPKLLFMLALLALAAVTAPPVAFPWSQPDAPYTELLALRINHAPSNASTASTTDWPDMPAATAGMQIIQLEGGRLAGASQGAFMLLGSDTDASGALYFLSVPRLDPTKATTTDSFRAAAAPTFHHLIGLPHARGLQMAVAGGELVALVGDGAIQWLKCSYTHACTVSRAAFPHGKVIAVAVSASTLWIATPTALHQADLQTHNLEAAPTLLGVMRAITTDGASRVAVATELEMEFSEDEGKTFSAHLGRYPIVGTLLDGPATDLAYAYCTFNGHLFATYSPKQVHFEGFRLKRAAI